MYTCKVCQLLWPQIQIFSFYELGTPDSDDHERCALYYVLYHQIQKLHLWSETFIKEIEDYFYQEHELKKRHLVWLLFRVRLIVLINNFAIDHAFLYARKPVRQRLIDEFQEKLLKSAGLSKALRRVDEEGRLTCSHLFRYDSLPGRRNDGPVDEDVDDFQMFFSGPPSSNVIASGTEPREMEASISREALIALGSAEVILELQKSLLEESRHSVQVTREITHENVQDLIAEACKPAILFGMGLTFKEFYDIYSFWSFDDRVKSYIGKDAHYQEIFSQSQKRIHEAMEADILDDLISEYIRGRRMDSRNQYKTTESIFSSQASSYKSCQRLLQQGVSSMVLSKTIPQVRFFNSIIYDVYVR
jgi:hypothetical protein